MASDIPYDLAGRDDELAVLTDAVVRVLAGNGEIVVLEGEPGIGKTALLDVVAERFGRGGATVLRAACTELEQGMPFAAIGSGLLAGDLPADPLLDRVQAFLRGQDVPGSGAMNHEYAVRETIVALADRWCAAGPVAVIVDDVQWTDPSSLAVVRQLAETARQSQLLVALACRPFPRAAGWAGLLTELERWGATRLSLGPVSDAGVARIVERTVGAPPGSSLATVMSSAGGNPLYAIELTACLRDEGAIEVVDGLAQRARCTEQTGHLPASLADTIMRRLAYLPEQTRSVLPIAAALGSGIEVTQLAMVLGESMLDLWEAVNAATTAGLLAAGSEGLTFRHELIRQVFAAQVPESTVRNLKHRAAQVMMAEGAPPEWTAQYLAADSGSMDEATVRWVVGAADALIVRAPELAQTLLGRALSSVGTESPHWNALLMQRIRSFLWLGDPAGAEPVVRFGLSVASEQNANPAVEILLYWLLKAACFAQGKLREAILEGEAALRLPALSRQQAGQFHGFNALAYYLMEEFDAAEDAATTAISIGEEFSDAVALQSGCMTLGLLRYTFGRLDEALALGDRVVAAYETGVAGQRADQFDPYIVRAYALIELDRPDDAEATLTSAMRHHQSVRPDQLVRSDRVTQHNQLSPAAFLVPNLSGLIRLHFVSGRWGDALAEVQACHDAPDILGYLPMMSLMGTLIDIHRGTVVDDPDTLPHPDNRVGSKHFRYLRPWVIALLDESAGRREEALSGLLDAALECESSLSWSTLYYAYPDIARMAEAVGDDRAARLVADAAERLAANQPTSSRRATALLCRGMADDRVELIAEATELFDRSGRSFYAAQAYEELAIGLAKQQRVVEAHTALAKAVEHYTTMDAEWDIARADARLRDYGVRRGRRGARNRPKTGWAALTVTEQRVVRLVALGHTNSDIAAQLFLSRRTVQSHVSSILTKLGLRSRVQVAVELANLAVPDRDATA